MPRKKNTVPVVHYDPETELSIISDCLKIKLSQKKSSSPQKSLIIFITSILKGLAWLHLVFILTTSFCLFLFKYINPGVTTLMLYRKYLYNYKIQAPRYIPLEKIPKTIQTMTIKVEDGDFYKHHGIIPAAIKNAWKLNQQFGEPVYGGSTITMQTARTIFLVPEKSYIRKYLEAIIALEMEAILGKKRILELYFNYAEWGKGIFGIETASRYYYKTGVRSISTDQAIRFVTILSSPLRYGPYNFQRNGILRSRYNYLVKRFAE
ncbi:transglycosylase domain-containing protein [Gracilinema caldarium]|uniref:Glycosyl transferase family 51 n=1 Tax=Gracilinema caldarium (strain ATCC 51460 / DSM 7334 / H1) TaxID=744872 RepID=F8F174_GRAC1|nr:transglycosylase domain-containing protein [Gracilinema caldarium]AEJ20864.1 glycosyl transferase family 51 [Gracilinema caldarium DSM 7334]